MAGSKLITWLNRHGIPVPSVHVLELPLVGDYIRQAGIAGASRLVHSLPPEEFAVLAQAVEARLDGDLDGDGKPDAK